MPTELNVYTPNNTCSIDRLSISFQKSLKSVSSFDFWKSNSVTTSMVKKKKYNQNNTTSDNNFGYYLFVGQFSPYSTD